MEENMINRLPVQFTQTAPINHNETSLSKIVHGKNLL